MVGTLRVRGMLIRQGGVNEEVPDQDKILEEGREVYKSLANQDFKKIQIFIIHSIFTQLRPKSNQKSYIGHCQLIQI